MKIVTTGGQAEIVEKKSRFIAQVFPVQTAEEAYANLAAVRKQYWDARHSCHAFVIGPNNETAHSSDDGEPQGTAGKPILEEIRTQLGVTAEKPTTDDMMFTVETVSCLGACGLAPVCTVNDVVYPSMTPEKARVMLKEIREKEARGE